MIFNEFISHFHYVSHTEVTQIVFVFSKIIISDEMTVVCDVNNYCSASCSSSQGTSIYLLIVDNNRVIAQIENWWPFYLGGIYLSFGYGLGGW